MIREQRMIWRYSTSRTSTHSRTELISQRREAARTWAADLGIVAAQQASLQTGFGFHRQAEPKMFW